MCLPFTPAIVLQRAPRSPLFLTAHCDIRRLIHKANTVARQLICIFSLLKCGSRSITIRSATHLGVPSVGGVEAGFAVGGGHGVPRPPGILTAQVAIKMRSEYAADAVQSNRVDAGIEKAETGKESY